MTRAQAEARRLVAAWNAAHPVGTRVAYWSALRRGAPTGEGTTLESARLWPNDVVAESAVVRIARDSGGTNYLALTHVEVVVRGTPRPA